MILIIKMRRPPKIEFPINLKIAFNGIENIFPITTKQTIHPIITKVFENSKCHPLLSSFLRSNTYDKTWTNMTYPTSFFLKYNSSIMFKEIPLCFALFTKKSNLLLLAFI